MADPSPCGEALWYPLFGILLQPPPARCAQCEAALTMHCFLQSAHLCEGLYGATLQRLAELGLIARRGPRDILGCFTALPSNKGYVPAHMYVNFQAVPLARAVDSCQGMAMVTSSALLLLINPQVLTSAAGQLPSSAKLG